MNYLKTFEQGAADARVLMLEENEQALSNFLDAAQGDGDIIEGRADYIKGFRSVLDPELMRLGFSAEDEGHLYEGNGFSVFSEGGFVVYYSQDEDGEGDELLAYNMD